MRIAEYRERLECRVRDAEQINATAPVANVLRVVIRELSVIDASTYPGRIVNTLEAAELLGVKPKTVANWAASGRFPGASKTSGSNGNWTIPLEEVSKAGNRKRPKLWKPE